MNEMLSPSRVTRADKRILSSVRLLDEGWSLIHSGIESPGEVLGAISSEARQLEQLCMQTPERTSELGRLIDLWHALAAAIVRKLN